MSDKELKKVYDECMEFKKQVAPDYIPKISFFELKRLVTYVNAHEELKKVGVDWVEQVLSPFYGFETYEQIKSIIDLALVPYTKHWDYRRERTRIRIKMGKRIMKNKKIKITRKAVIT